VIIDNNKSDETNIGDKIENVFGDIEIRYIEQDLNLYNIFTTPELVFRSIKSINISNL
jgi:hypothetical protein